jgi:hypothetical protein
MGLSTICPIINSAQFRSDFPEFSDKTKYPDSAVNYWLAVATLLLVPDRWANVLQLGVELYIAHNMVLEAMSLDTAKAGGWPGLSKGTIQSESPGAVTIAYDSEPVLETDGGHWNLTVYGTRFLRFARMAGAGPIQVGPCGPGAGTLTGDFYNSSGPGWSGPPMKPGILG